MATEYVKIKGKLKWCNHMQKPDSYNGMKEFWKISVLWDSISDEDKKKLKDGGCRNKPTEDGEGETIVNFRRDVTKTIRGEVVEFDPPLWLDDDGEPITVPVAHGSEGIISLQLYDAGALGKGTRLQGVMVTNLIPYESDKDDEEEMPKGGLDKSIFE